MKNWLSSELRTTFHEELYSRIGDSDERFGSRFSHFTNMIQDRSFGKKSQTKSPKADAVFSCTINYIVSLKVYFKYFQLLTTTLKWSK